MADFLLTMDELPKFSADDSTQPLKSWLKQVSSISTEYGWSQEETCLAATKALGGLAKLWFDSQESIIVTWSDFRTRLGIEFGTDFADLSMHASMTQEGHQIPETKVFDEDIERWVLGFFEDIDRYVLGYVRDRIMHCLRRLMIIGLISLFFYTILLSPRPAIHQESKKSL